MSRNPEVPKSRNPLNILLTDFYGGMAGSTMSVSYLAKGLTENGHNVTVVCPKNSVLEELLKNTKVAIEAWKIKGKLDLNTAKKIKQLVVDKQIQLVDVQASKDRYVVAWAHWFYGLKIPIVYTRRQDPKSSLGSLQRKFYVASSDKIKVISHGLKDIFIKKGYPTEHLSVIHNGIDPKRYTQWSTQEVLTYKKQFDIQEHEVLIGAVSRLKEQTQILEAVKQLDNLNIVLLFAGIKTGILDDFANKIGLTNRIVYAGMVSNDKVLNIYHLLHINILASTMDGFGLVLLEAMAMECPVIGTRFGGIKDVIVHGENGFLFNDKDINTLTAQIQQLLNDNNLRRLFIENGKKTAFQTFTLNQTIQKHIQFYQNMITEYKI